jgi:hypothetical protein
MTDKEQETYTTEDGIELKLRAIHPNVLSKAAMAVEDEFRERGEPLDVPTYMVPTVGGGEQGPFPLDEESLDVPGDDEKTKLNHARWNAYLAAQVRLDEAQAERYARASFIYGIDWDSIKLPEDDSWRMMQEMVGIKIPENEIELKLHYLLAEILTPYDSQLLLPMISVLSAGRSVSPEDQDKFREAVRGAVEERGRLKAMAALHTYGIVVHAAKIFRDGISASLGDSAEPVGQPDEGRQGGDDGASTGEGEDERIREQAVGETE